MYKPSGNRRSSCGGLRRHRCLRCACGLYAGALKAAPAPRPGDRAASPPQLAAGAVHSRARGEPIGSRGTRALKRARRRPLTAKEKLLCRPAANTAAKRAVRCAASQAPPRFRRWRPRAQTARPLIRRTNRGERGDPAPVAWMKSPFLPPPRPCRRAPAADEAAKRSTPPTARKRKMLRKSTHHHIPFFAC